MQYATTNNDGENAFSLSATALLALNSELIALGNSYWASMLPSFASQVAKGRSLSDKQMGCVKTALAQLAKAKAKVAPVALVSKSEIEKGRYEVSFVVTHLKAYETGGYSWSYETIKAVGLTDKGFKVYVSIPEALQADVKVGTKVAMTATVTPKDDGFASLTRPFNARIIG